MDYAPSATVDLAIAMARGKDHLRAAVETALAAMNAGGTLANWVSVAGLTNVLATGATSTNAAGK